MPSKLKILKVATIIIGGWILIFMLMETVNISKSHTSSQRNYKGLFHSQTNENSLQPTYKPYMGELGGTQEPNEADLRKLLSLELPNVPFDYWLRNEHNQTFENNTSCTKYPTPLQLQFHNTYWQTLDMGEVRFQLYGAYLDKRSGLPQDRPVVRILAMVNRDGGYPPSSCQLWYDNRNEAVIVPVTEYQMLWPRWWHYFPNYLYPIFLNCQLPETESESASTRTSIPQVVSVAAVPCAKATNSLHINYETPATNETRKKYAICVKGIDFPNTDISARLIEWLELMRLLGADRIVIYHLASHPNVRRVLEHYRKINFIELRHTTLASGEPGLANFQHLALQRSLRNKRYNELIPFNDCFYRHMYKYEFIAAFDIDEVIMPLGNNTNWHDLYKVTETLAALNRSTCPLGFASFCFHNIYFPNRPKKTRHQLALNAPAYMHMLQHVQRYTRHSPEYYETKCFHGTRQVLVLHNHMSLMWMDGVCRPTLVAKQHAQLQHYKVSQPEYETDPLILDDNIWRFKLDLVERTQNVLKVLGFIS